MLERLLRFSVANRWLVLLLTLVAAAIGAYSLTRLPIDAVPDITNVQVQINTLFPALSPLEIEKQVTLPLETALAGIPGLESTRSLSRNGFSQITAVFSDGTDIYFARQQIKERLDAAKEALPPGAEPEMGAVSTGLGEIYMYTVEYKHPGGQGRTSTTVKPIGKATGRISRPKVSDSKMMSKRRHTCGPHRIGSSARNCAMWPASREWIRSADTSSNIRSNRTR